MSLNRTAHFESHTNTVIHLYLNLFLLHSSSTTWNSSGTGNPRREVTRSQYQEDDTSDSFVEEEDEDGEQSVSISSRGRIRKISSKVRGYFRE